MNSNDLTDEQKDELLEFALEIRRPRRRSPLQDWGYPEILRLVTGAPPPPTWPALRARKDGWSVYSASNVVAKILKRPHKSVRIGFYGWLRKRGIKLPL